MDPKSLSESVFSNPYLIEKIVRELDIRTLFKCCAISKDFFDASVYEYEKRKDIIHLYLLRFNFSQNCKDLQKLSESFIQYTKLWLNMRPKSVLILIGGYRQSIDYRLRSTSLSKLTKYLPKNCFINYLDVGHSILTSSIRSKSLTNYEERQNGNDLFQRTAFPCIISMSCLFFPEEEGIEVRTYVDFDQINKENVKCVLFFQSLEELESNSNRHSEESESIQALIEKVGNKVGFGGGSIKALKTMENSWTKGDVLRTQMIMTFRGKKVKSASIVLSTINKKSFFLNLVKFKSLLDFDCNDSQKSTTIAFIFANNENFSQEFTTAFQSVFPCVGIFGFQSLQRMYGHFYGNGKTFITRNRFRETIDPKRNSVIVLINFEFKKRPYH